MDSLSSTRLIFVKLCVILLIFQVQQKLATVKNKNGKKIISKFQKMEPINNDIYLYVHSEVIIVVCIEEQ